jgi:trehalose 6-phosphate synthase/phosphatase
MRLVVVSNRLPFTVAVVDGKPRFRDSSGGLVTGLWSYLERRNAASGEKLEYIWMGWPGGSVAPEHQAKVRGHGQERYKAWPVFLSEESMDRFYHGFCNKTIWPLFHYFSSLARYEEEYWTEYKQVNAAFCEALLEVLRPDDLVWIHDYQLMLLPAMLRERFPAHPISVV